MATIKDENMLECHCPYCNSNVIYNTKYDVIKTSKECDEGCDILPQKFRKKYKKQIDEAWIQMNRLLDVKRKITTTDTALWSEDYFDVDYLECPKCHKRIRHAKFVEEKNYVRVYCGEYKNGDYINYEDGDVYIKMDEKNILNVSPEVLEKRNDEAYQFKINRYG